MTTLPLSWTHYRCRGCKHEDVVPVCPDQCPVCNVRNFETHDERAGQLVLRRTNARMGYLWVNIWQCGGCRTDYTQLTSLLDGPEPLTVNGYVTELCPWCRSDSAPWAFGRGA